MKHSITRIIISILSIISIYLIFLLLNLYSSNPLVFPHPNLIIINFSKMLIAKEIYLILLIEIIKLIVVVFISFVLSLLLVYFSYRYNLFKTFISPYITILRSIPVVVIISILMAIIDLDITPYVLTTLILIPISYETILGGLNGISLNVKRSYLLESKKNIKLFINMELPLVKEEIKSSYINNIGLGFKVMVMAEFITYTPNSFGSIIISSANNFEYVNLYAFSIFILIIVLLFEKITKIFK